MNAARISLLLTETHQSIIAEFLRAHPDSDYTEIGAALRPQLPEVGMGTIMAAVRAALPPRYVLSSAVLTAPGAYTYRLLSPGEARNWLRRGPFTSAVGYAETAQALSDLTGVEVPANRTTAVMEPGAEALVFRLVFPPGTPRVDPARKGALSPAFVAQHSELGLLRREEA